MTTKPFQFPTPLSLALAVIGSAATPQIMGSLDAYSPHRQSFRLYDRRTGAFAHLVIARAPQGASVFTIMIRQVTTERLRRHVTRTLRAFVRETQAPLITVLAEQAASVTPCLSFTDSIGVISRRFLMTTTPSPSPSRKPWNDRNHAEFEGRAGVPASVGPPERKSAY